MQVRQKNTETIPDKPSPEKIRQLIADLRADADWLGCSPEVTVRLVREAADTLESLLR
jgi:hypothetical protein